MKLIKIFISKIKNKIENYREKRRIEKIFNNKDPFIYK